MEKSNEVVISVPFEGFDYESTHDRNFENAIELMSSDNSGEIDLDKAQELYEKIDWDKARLRYAKHYAKVFATSLSEYSELFTADDLKFAEFKDAFGFHAIRADYLHCAMTVKNVRTMFNHIKDAEFEKFVDEYLPYDIRYSDYPPDVDVWGPVEDWDEHQLGLLLMAHCQRINFDLKLFETSDFLETVNCNGEVEEFMGF